MKLPSDTELDLLNALGRQEISGRDLARQYQKETGKNLSYGTLYSAMRRLKDAGWVEARDDEDEDGRVRFFKISPNGSRALPHVHSLKSIGLGVPA